MIMEYDGSYSSEPSKKPKAMAGRLSAQNGRTKKAPYVSNEEGEESLEGKMEAWDGSEPSRSDNGYDDDNIIVPSTTVAVTEQNSTAPTHAKYKGNIVEIPNGQNGSTHKYILINKRNERAATEYLTNDIFFSKKSFYENPILSSDDFIFESMGHAIAHVASPLSFLMSFSVEDNKKNSLEFAAVAALGAIGVATLGPVGYWLTLAPSAFLVASKILIHPYIKYTHKTREAKYAREIVQDLKDIAISEEAEKDPVFKPFLQAHKDKFQKRFSNVPEAWVAFAELPFANPYHIFGNIEKLIDIDNAQLTNTFKLLDHIYKIYGRFESSLGNIKLNYKVATILASYQNFPREMTLAILNNSTVRRKEEIIDAVNLFREKIQLTDNEAREFMKHKEFDLQTIDTVVGGLTPLSQIIPVVESSQNLITVQAEEEKPLPPHITPEQVARVKDNLAQLDIASQVNAALTTGSVSAAHKVGEAEINEISRILSTINTDSQLTLDVAKGLIERLTPVSEMITRSQNDIALLRDNSLWGMARRAFNRLTIHRFAANATANFNDIDRDVAESRATSISLMERFETLGSLGKLLDAPLMKIKDTIETALGETTASSDVETVLRATQKHAMTLWALSHQAQQMVGMLVTGESNFATFTRGIGIANVATGLAQTVNDMAEKNRMAMGLAAPMNDQIETSMRLFETRLMEVQAQIAEHAAEFEKGAKLAREFQTNVLLSLPAPEQDLGNPLDQLAIQPRETTSVPPRSTRPFFR